MPGSGRWWRRQGEAFQDPFLRPGSRVSRWAGQGVCERGVNADLGSGQNIQGGSVFLAEPGREAGAGGREEDWELCSGCVQLSSCPFGRARGAVGGQQLRELGPEVGGGRGEVQTQTGKVAGPLESER